MSTIQATIKYKAMNSDTSRGKRSNVVIDLPEGGTGKIRGQPDDPQLFALSKGQSVRVVKRGASYQLAADPEPDGAPPEASKPTPAITGGPTRKEVEEYIIRLARLYELCFKTAQNVMRDYNLRDEDLRAIATNLQIAVRRRFDL